MIKWNRWMLFILRLFVSKWIVTVRYWWTRFILCFFICNIAYIFTFLNDPWGELETFTWKRFKVWLCSSVLINIWDTNIIVLFSCVYALFLFKKIDSFEKFRKKLCYSVTGLNKQKWSLKTFKVALIFFNCTRYVFDI